MIQNSNFIVLIGLFVLMGAMLSPSSSKAGPNDARIDVSEVYDLDASIRRLSGAQTDKLQIFLDDSGASLSPSDRKYLSIILSMASDNSIANGNGRFNGGAEYARLPDYVVQSAVSFAEKFAADAGNSGFYEMRDQNLGVNDLARAVLKRRSCAWIFGGG